jgi:hypothetical protein
MTHESGTPSPLWPNRPTRPEHDKQRPRDNSRPVHDNGTFTPASAAPASRAALSAAFDIDQPPFATVRRGYDPAAVDAHLAQLDESVAALRSALEESERRRAMAEQHAVAVEEEIRVVRSGMLSAPAPDTGFGARAERMLRLAESEAEQVRAAAQRSASEMTERALSEAEQHRHDVRQQLIAESARAEEHAARRGSELQEREESLRTQINRMRADAEAIQAAAQRAAESHRAVARADADELRNRTARDLARARELEERELTRLRDLQGAARLELARLASTIRAALPAAPARPSPGPARGASRSVNTEQGTGGASPDTPPNRAYAEVAAATK